MDSFFVNSPLSPEERAQARAHWIALMFAPSQHHLLAAREALKAGPLSVQKAVTNAIAIFWREGRKPSPEQTPFD
jgi:hypothetical protein